MIIGVQDFQGIKQPCRALLDAGSQANFITERLAHCLKLEHIHNIHPIHVINNITSTAKQSVNINIH